MNGNSQIGLSWSSIIRLGLVQASLGSVVVLTTSTLNRVMVVELSLLAAVPGLLVGLHYAVQLLRPLWGHISDRGGSRTSWIIGGVAMLAVAGTVASIATALMATAFWIGLALSVVAYTMIGFGIGAAGTSLLALIASRTAASRRPAAATLVWTLMIFGIVLTAGITGALLDPFTFERLVIVTATTGVIALAVAVLAVWGIEARSEAVARREPDRAPFHEALTEAWHDPDARAFTVFVFVSMLAYSAQDLILEPFAGLVHGMTPGQTTQLAGTQHGGVLLGMILVGTVGTWLSRRHRGVLKAIVIGGCMLSAASLVALAIGARSPGTWLVSANVFALGVSNGAFAVAAIGSMLALAASGPHGASRAGVRMGVWGAAQAIAFGLGGLLGAVSVDAVGLLIAEVPFRYAIVFGAEALLFVAAAWIARNLVLGTAAPTLASTEADLAEIGLEPIRTPLEPAE